MRVVVDESRYSFRFWLANFRRSFEIAACSRKTGQWLPIFLDYIGLHSLDYPYQLLLRSGDRLVLREHTDVIVFWMVFARHHYPVLSSHRVIVDVGANIGIFALYAAREAPCARIIAVEPFPDTRERLEETVDANGLRDRVTVLNCALSSAAEVKAMDSADCIPSQYRRIYSPALRTLNSSHRGPAGTEQDDYGIFVRTETLSYILDCTGIESADLLKMNIHGSEYDVLLSTPPEVLQRCRRIAVQYHELPAEMCMGKEQLFEHLRAIGFRLLQDDDTHRGAGLAMFTASP